MNIKGLIFDLDGTLIDSVEDIGDSLNKVLEARSLKTYTVEEYRQMVGGGFRNLVTRAVDEDIEEILEDFQQVYSENYLSKTRPYEGIIELLDEITRSGIKIGINTNKYQLYGEKIVEKLFSKYDFVDIIGSREDIELKPSFQGADMLIKKMNLDRDQVIYVGDSSVDILTAKAGNISSIGVAWGFRGREELLSYGADFIVENPLEILEIIR